MQIHTGRLIDHLHLQVRDLATSAGLYGAILDALGLPHLSDAQHFEADELYITEGSPLGHCHLAFQAPDRETVRRVYDAALAAGARDNGAPGERDYHPGYYAAFFYDPDGNNLEAVTHGLVMRSADSVTITTAD